MLKVISKVGLVALGLIAVHQPVHAKSEHDVGEILPVAGFNCPADTMEANGQTVQIRNNHVLYSVIGVTYGGDGRNTFALPNLIGREVIHVGTGPGMNPPQNRFQSELGGKGGSQVFYITADNIVPHTHMAAHTHGAESHVHQATVSTHRGVGNTNTPVGGSFGTFPVGTSPYTAGEPDGDNMASGVITVSKNSPDMGGVAIEGPLSATSATISAGPRAEIAHRSPFLTIRYCIVTNGTYPLRD